MRVNKFIKFSIWIAWGILRGKIFIPSNVKIDMKVILVRHCESIANSKGIHQGQRVDTSLSEKGKEQARKVARALKDEKIESIYSSDLKRAMETAQEIAKFHNIKVISDKRLREFDSGDFTHLKDRWEKFMKFKDSEATSQIAISL